MFGRIDPTNPPPPRELIASLLAAGTAARTRQTPAQRQNQAVFIAHLTRMLVQIVREDGDIDGRDRILIVKLLKQELRLADAHLERIRRHLPREAAESLDPDTLSADFRARFAPASRLLAAELCCRLAVAMWPPAEGRLGRALRIVAGLGLEPLQRRNLESKHGLCAERTRAQEPSRRHEEARQQEEARREEARRRRVPLTPEDERAFAVLGLPPDAPFSAIRKAYRGLAHRHHPDAVSHLGEARRRVATERMQAINAAYGRLERRFDKEADDPFR